MTISAIPPPLPAGDVCATCRQYSGTYLRCYSCKQVIESLGLGEHHPVPVVLPIGMSRKGSPLAAALWDYKRGRTSRDQARARDDLLDFLDRRLAHVVTHAGAVDLFTFTPHRSSGDGHLHRLLENTRWGRTHQLQPILSVVDYAVETHTPDTERFSSQPVDGLRVVLFDDTFTKGATSMSAAHALFEAGARSVTIIVIGRYGDASRASEDYLLRADTRESAGKFCPACEATLEGFDPSQVAKSDRATDWPSRGWEPPPDPWDEPADDYPYDEYDEYDEEDDAEDTLDPSPTQHPRPPQPRRPPAPTVSAPPPRPRKRATPPKLVIMPASAPPRPFQQHAPITTQAYEHAPDPEPRLSEGWAYGGTALVMLPMFVLAANALNIGDLFYVSWLIYLAIVAFIAFGLMAVHRAAALALLGLAAAISVWLVAISIIV